jgi:hypothetical protein
VSLDWMMIRDVAAVVAGIVAIIGIIYIALNKAAMDNYRVTIDSQNGRIAAQEGEITELKVAHVDSGRRLDDLEAALEGQKQGYEFAMTVFATAVANAGICAVAWDCSNRVLPETVESKPRTHKAARVKVGGTD